MNLYEIAAELRQVEERAIDPETGEIDPDFESWLDSLEMLKAEKVLGLCVVAKEARAEREAVVNELNRLKRRAESLEHKQDRIKAYITGSIEVGQKFKNAHTSLHWSHSNSVAGSVLDTPEKLPEGFQRITIEANRTEIKKAIEEGHADLLALGDAHIERRDYIVIK